MRLILAYQAPVGQASRLTFDHNARGDVHFTDFSPGGDSACLASQTPAQFQIKQIAADARIAALMRELCRSPDNRKRIVDPTARL